MIKLFVSDVDGTLLLKDKEQIDKSVFDAIKKLKEAGIKTAAASGRTYGSLEKLFYPVKDGMYFIGCDGAVTVLDDKVLYTRQISMSDVFTVINSDMYKDCGVIVCCPKKSYILRGSEKVAKLVYEQTLENPEPIFKLYGLTEPICKICVFSDSGNISYLPFMPKSLRVSYLSKNWCEYTSVISDKGLAVSDLQMRLYLSKFDTACMGDGINDVVMMKKASIAVSANNAYDKLKEICMYHTDDAAGFMENVASGIVK